MFNSSLITSITCCGTTLSFSRSLNFSSMASLSSFSRPSSFLMIFSCSCRRYFLWVSLIFSSTYETRTKHCVISAGHKIMTLPDTNNSCWDSHSPPTPTVSCLSFTIHHYLCKMSRIIRASSCYKQTCG